MGLDMYLYAEKYVSGVEWTQGKDGVPSSKPSAEFSAILETAGLSPDDLRSEYPSARLMFQVAYWRKVNAIHQWFVDNCGDGVDECQPYDVQRADLVVLLMMVNEAIETRNGEVLAPQSGFFFGSTEIDEWYWKDLEATREMLTAIVDNPKFENYGFTYQASW